MRSVKLTALLCAAALAAAAAVAAAPAAASHGETVFFEAPRDLLGVSTATRTQTIATLTSLGVPAVRIVLYWRDVAPKPTSRHQPHFNIRLKDDKTYPYIKVTLNEAWPRVIPTRRVLEDGARYFGPYPGMGTVHATIDLLDKLFPFRTCDKEITGKDARPCTRRSGSRRWGTAVAAWAGRSTPKRDWWSWSRRRTS